jgi:hypothetical protein
MSHFRYIVDFKIGSYSNCKYKSFVLNVIKSIKSIRSYNVLFLSYFPLFITIFLFFKEKTRRIFITIGASIGTTNILHLICLSEARRIFVVEQLFGFFLGHNDKVVLFEFYFTLFHYLIILRTLRISFVKQFVRILPSSE